jgi:hypothetical protein
MSTSTPPEASPPGISLREMWPETFFRRYFWIFLGMVIAFRVFTEYQIANSPGYRLLGAPSASVNTATQNHWPLDILYDAELLIFFLCYPLFRQVPGRLRYMFIRLADRGALLLPGDDRQSLQAKLQQQSDRLAWIFGFLVAGVAAEADIRFDILHFLPSLPPTAASQTNVYLDLVEPAAETVVALVLGFIAGLIIGRTVAYGYLGRLLRTHGSVLHAQPGHLDGAAGLKPVGDFYFSQALIFAIPSFFVLFSYVFLKLIPASSFPSFWTNALLPVLGISIVVEIGTFIMPLLYFHTEMLEQKVMLLRGADRLSAQVAALQAELITDVHAAIPTDFTDRIEAQTNYYTAVQHLPTWPVATGTWARFFVGNAGLILPLLSQFLVSTGWLTSAIDALQKR